MQLLITDAGRERLARWLFIQLSPLASAGVHWLHLGDTPARCGSITPTT